MINRAQSTLRSQDELDQSHSCPFVWKPRLPRGGFVLGVPDKIEESWEPAPKNLASYLRAYEWADIEEVENQGDDPLPDGWLITKRVQRAAGTTAEPVYLAGSAIHRDFSELKDESAILGFANEFGFLGDHSLVSFQGRRQFAESLATWRAEITRIRTLLCIHDLLEEDNSDSRNKLRAYVTMDEPENDRFSLSITVDEVRTGFSERFRTVKAEFFEHPMSGMPDEFVADVRSMSGLSGSALEGEFRLIRGPKNIREVARYLIIDAINQRLMGGTGIAIDPKNPRHLKVAVETLRGAIYSSLMLEITKQTALLRQCRTCGKWFESRNLKKVFCTPAHAKQASRWNLAKNTEGK